MNNYSQIFMTIDDNLQALMPKRPIIGISGAYTSGKTSFTERLSEHLTLQGKKNIIIHFDDFHYPLSSIIWETNNLDSEVEAFYNHAFNYDKLIQDILRPLTRDGYLKKRIATFNWSTDQYDLEQSFEIDEDTIVLLEGMLLFRPEVNDYLTYKIFLDVSAEEILTRGKGRDVPKFGNWIIEKYETRYIPVYLRYLSEDRPNVAADLVIDNNDFNHPKIQIIK